MKKVLFTVLAGVLAGMSFAPARAEDDMDKKFDFNGDVRVRYEYLNNYLDAKDTDDTTNANSDNSSFAPYRVRVGLTGNFAKNVSAHVDLQYNGHMGDQFNPAWDNPFFSTFPVPVGQGDPYQFITSGLQVYQGYIDVAKIGGSDFGLRIGRQEHTYGTELFLGDNDYYAGRTFDGVRGMWQHGGSDLNLFYYKISENNCGGPCFGLSSSADSNLFGGTYDWHFTTWGTVGGYVLIGQDLGGDGPVGFPDSKLNVYGVRWNRGMMTDDKLNMFDWDIEYAKESGDALNPAAAAFKFKLGGSVAEGWFGFNYKAGNSHGRAHIGAFMSSGDNASTTKDESFAPLYGDFHANNRLGDMDWVDEWGSHNITDYNAGYDHWFGDEHHVMFAYHKFKATKSSGAPSSDIGDEIDLRYDYMYSKNLTFGVMLGQVNPGDGVQLIYPYTLAANAKDSIQRISVSAQLHW